MQTMLYTYGVEIEKDGFNVPTGTFYGILAATISMRVPIVDESFDHSFGTHKQSGYDLDSSCYEIEASELNVVDENGAIMTIADYEPTKKDAEELFTEARRLFLHDIGAYTYERLII